MKKGVLFMDNYPEQQINQLCENILKKVDAMFKKSDSKVKKEIKTTETKKNKEKKTKVIFGESLEVFSLLNTQLVQTSN